nr:MAG TPA: hypothetical protein [Caudoviricetes sp.]
MVGGGLKKFLRRKYITARTLNSRKKSLMKSVYLTT